MKIKPLADYILIEPISEGEKTASGIIIPETADKERPEQGLVVAVGPGKMLDSGERRPMTVKKGEKVIFSKYGPTEISVDGQEYLMAREDDVMAVID
ncbi:MAG TPA: co-chaperone GroES [Candidatus Pacearchaeota archaeon]|nr:co-chaperone GroES [Candidatus Pacearchaeota archaeon]